MISLNDGIWRLAILTTVLLCGCNGRPAGRQGVVDGQEVREPAASAPQSIVGTWEFVSASVSERLRAAYLETRYTFSEKDIQIDYNPDMSHTVHGPLRYEIDPANRPNWIRVEGVGGDVAYWVEGTYSIQEDTLHLEIFGLSGVLRRVEPRSEVRQLTFDETLREFATGLPRSEEARADDERIEGRWRSLAVNAEGVADELALRDGKMVWSSPSYPHPNPNYYVLDASKEPKHINLIDDSRDGEWGGVAYLAGIYRLAGDRLTLCTAREGHGRPSDFVVDDEERRYISRFQRVDDRGR